ncbi:MAG: hypothetical protein RIR76_3667, partial [Verrucomicrobiota bacterium]
YQMLMVVRPLPTLSRLMSEAERHSARKAAELTPVS